MNRKILFGGLLLSLFSMGALVSCSSDDKEAPATTNAPVTTDNPGNNSNTPNTETPGSNTNNTGGENPDPVLKNHRPAGMRVVVAVFGETGDALNVQDADANTTKDYVMAGSGFQHRVLVEDFTGAWCGWCPRVSHSIEELELSNNDKLVAVAVHNGDKLVFDKPGALANSLWAKFNIPSNQRGYPFAVLNRQTPWAAKSGNEMNTAQLLSLAKASSDIGIKISSNLSSTSGSVDVSFKFKETYTGVIKYVVYIVQDDIILTQSNYTTNYGGKGNKTNFYHNSVAKANTGDIFGTLIPSENTVEGNEFTTGTLNVTYPNF